MCGLFGDLTGPRHPQNHRLTQVGLAADWRYLGLPHDDLSRPQPDGITRHQERAAGVSRLPLIWSDPVKSLAVFLLPVLQLRVFSYSQLRAAEGELDG